MPIEMVFNELSIQHTAPDLDTARRWMSGLVMVLRKASSCGVSRVLRTMDTFYASELMSGYSLMTWQADERVDKEERRFFKSLATRAPYLDGVQDSDLLERERLTECNFNGVTAVGLGIAHLLDGLAVSILSHVQWNAHELSVELSEL